jgi:hypothetical protein
MRGWKVTALQNWGVDGRCGKIGMCMSEILDDLFSGGVSLNPCRKWTTVDGVWRSDDGHLFLVRLF